MRKSIETERTPLKRPLEGEVKLQWFEVTGPEFDHFERISNALAQVEDGTYGCCARCRKCIETEILAERPWAALCLECEDRRGRR